MWSFTQATKPNRMAALAQYRSRASIYDLELVLFEPIREEAITRLALQRGDTVFDVGCGTGLSFIRLQEEIGPSGHIIGIEQCPEMLQQAQARVRQHGWQNVTLLCEPVETAGIGARADAALFHFTHDILRSPRAVGNVVGHLEPHGRVVAAGIQWASLWAWPANWAVLPIALHSTSSLEGLHRPWDRLASLIGNLDVQTCCMGAIYIASGVLDTQPHPALMIESSH
jgi:SAM-dependent methyltransferase